MEKQVDLVKVKFQLVQFSEPEITTFKSISCRNYISVSTDIYNPNSPIWVNFGVLSNFVRLYIYYWNREVHSNTQFAIEQRAMLYNILGKITHVYNLANKYNSILFKWVDLRKLYKAAITNKMENLFLVNHPRHEYNCLEIEKIGLEQSKTELMHDLLDEIHIKDLIIFSKLMAFQLHGIRIK